MRPPSTVASSLPPPAITLCRLKGVACSLCPPRLLRRSSNADARLWLGLSTTFLAKDTLRMKLRDARDCEAGEAEGARPQASGGELPCCKLVVPASFTATACFIVHTNQEC
eukprot:637416-Pelagomonas_calceolata.AAC.1